MADTSGTDATRPAKRSKIAGRVAYGSPPMQFLEENKKTLVFDIHNFPNLQEEIITKTIEAFGHQWGLIIYPPGHPLSSTIILCYYGKRGEDNPVVVKTGLRTKTVNIKRTVAYKYSCEDNKVCWWCHIKKYEDLIREDCTKDGTLTIEVDIIPATPERSQLVWSPNLDHSFGNIVPELYRSLDDTFDVTFLVGPSEKKLKAHKNILSIRAKALYDLIITEEASTTAASRRDTTTIVLPKIDTKTFDTLLKFAYGFVPEFNNNDDINKEATARSILAVADRYGCTELKLHVESYLVQNILVPTNAASLFLFADSYSTPLLKEASMNRYMTDAEAFMGADRAWKTLQESTKLLTELLVYTNRGRNKSSSVVVEGDGTTTDADNFDVTSLRERLEKYNLDLDGSRAMLLQRWKQFLLDRNAA